MRFQTWLIAAAAALVLTACGGGDESTAQVSAQPQRAQPLMAASTTAISNANRLMDYAEATFPGIFGSTKTAGTLGGIMYRYYAATGVYLGVVVDTQPSLVTGGVYVLGGPFGGLTYKGQLSSYIAATPDTKTLTVTVNVLGQTSTVTVAGVPVQNTQADFCGSLTSDTTLKSLAQVYGTASYSINTCSFNGTTGTVTASVLYQGQTIPISLSYTFT
jgi:hypothetical protein